MARFQHGIERLERHCRDAGRNPKEIALAYRVTQRGATVPEKADNGDRRLFSGSSEAIVQDLRAFKDLGIVAVDFSFDGADAGEVVANMRRFREDVLAKG
jgi:DNA-binding transcriptional MerR regulator